MPEAPAAEKPAAEIMIVDDTPATLQVLSAMLTMQGYHTRPLPSGPAALESAAADPPDLILLDIPMPEMDGYEVCRRLKADPTLRDIPVILLSSLDDTSYIVMGFRAGAVDYLTLPLQFEEVQARVETHLKIRRLQDELRQQYRELRDSYDRLRELEGLRDSLTHMIVHDLRTPLTAIVTGLETLVGADNLAQNQREVVAIARQGGETLLGMIGDLLEVGKMEDGSLTLRRGPVDAAALVAECVKQVTALAADKSLSITTRLEGGLPTLSADLDKLRRVLVNLLGNAIKYTHDGGVTVTVARDPAAGALRFSVADTGEGIPETAFEHIFDKFGQVEGRETYRRMSTGLGLTFCKMAVEAHGGRIWVESDLGEGSTFYFTIPLGAG